MRSSKMSSVEELQVIGRFESLRKVLLSDDYAEHLEKPLAYWALPSDRRLPLAFLGRTLKELLNTPFAELSDTPGIGHRKLASFVQLLARAANTDPSQLPLDYASAAKKNGQSGCLDKPLVEHSNGFDPETVSEVVWNQWRASVVEHGLADEKLGRFAPSLRNMTRVIWNTPLGAYVDCTLAEMRSMKTHGERRIRAILEVFYSVHSIVANMGVQDHLVVRIEPRRIDRVEQWVGRALQTPGLPSAEEILDHFVGPLFEQIRVDATQQIASLAKNRLGIDAPITSVRQAARTLGLTRARVYQLLNEINDILVVRWPTGRHQVYELREKLETEADAMDNPPDLRQFQAAIEMFYPGSRRGAAGPLEPATMSEELDRSPAESDVAVG